LGVNRNCFVFYQHSYLLSCICCSLATEIKEIRADLEPDAEKIILKFAQGKSSRLQNLIDGLIGYVPAAKLMLDSNFIKFNDKKVVVSSNLTSQQGHEYFDRLKKMGLMLLGPRVMETFL
jgi:hypothetical protein